MAHSASEHWIQVTLTDQDRLTSQTPVANISA